MKRRTFLSIAGALIVIPVTSVAHSNDWRPMDVMPHGEWCRMGVRAWLKEDARMIEGSRKVRIMNNRLYRAQGTSHPIEPWRYTNFEILGWKPWTRQDPTCAYYDDTEHYYQDGRTSVTIN